MGLDNLNQVWHQRLEGQVCLVPQAKHQRIAAGWKGFGLTHRNGGRLLRHTSAISGSGGERVSDWNDGFEVGPTQLSPQCGDNVFIAICPDRT